VRQGLGSSRHGLKTILVVKSAENWRRDDAMAVTNPMASRDGREALVRWLVIRVARLAYSKDDGQK
jgi:hypothetical protein